MKVGDIVEWRGLNKVHRGVITEQSIEIKYLPAASDSGSLVIKVDNGKFLALKDVIHSKSFRVL